MVHSVRRGPAPIAVLGHTIGLSAGFNHSELIVPGVRPDDAARLLNQLGRMVRKGDLLSPQDCFVDSLGRHTHLSKVHPAHFDRGVFAAWRDYYGCLGPPHPTAVALEVVLPGRKEMLDRPRSTLGGP
jgi:hypothetical protein